VKSFPDNPGQFLPFVKFFGINAGLLRLASMFPFQYFITRPTQTNVSGEYALQVDIGIGKLACLFIRCTGSSGRHFLNILKFGRDGSLKRSDLTIRPDIGWHRLEMPVPNSPCAPLVKEESDKS
jgi:hypothetical protein